MARRKMEELGLNLPPVPTMAVGSLPDAPVLQEAKAAAGRDGLSGTALEQKLKESIEYWIGKQEETGLEILVDGEPYREDPVSHFASRLKGFRRGGLVRERGDSFRRRPVIRGRVRWEEPLTLNWWRYAQGLTGRPVKAVLCGPYTLMHSSFDEHYPNRRAAARALAAEIRREAEALVEAGCRVIQLDEPALAARPDELALAAEAIGIVTQRLPAYVIAHACYGDFARACRGLADLPVDNLDLEMASSDMEFLKAAAALSSPFPFDVSAGVVDSVSTRVDTADTVRGRIRKALKVFKPDRLWVDPDCGLRGLSPGEAEGRLKVLREAVAEARRGGG